VIWATGYVRRYPWLRVPVRDADGELVHRGGVTRSRGLYALGLTFMRRRRSHFIDGCGVDAAEIADEIADLLRHRKKAHGVSGRLGFGHGSVVRA
jgi:putative flavoprotein involved in K+ transport